MSPGSLCFSGGRPVVPPSPGLKSRVCVFLLFQTLSPGGQVQILLLPLGQKNFSHFFFDLKFSFLSNSISL